MARKPTPSILAEEPTPVSDEDVLLTPPPDAAPVAEELPAQPEVKKPSRPRPAKKPAPAVEPEAVTEEAVEAVVEAVEQVAEAVVEAVQDEPVIEEIPLEGEGAEEAVITFKLPESVTAAMKNMPPPVSSTMRVALLASLGLASYAIETSVFVITKLVERGELTQKEGLKIVGDMSKRLRIPLPGMGGKKPEAEAVPEAELEGNPENPGEPAVESASADLAVAEPVVGELIETGEEPAEEDKEETGVRSDHDQVQTNVLALHVFNLGSPITISAPKLKKK
jgi:hypothetical protein